MKCDLRRSPRARQKSRQGRTENDNSVHDLLIRGESPASFPRRLSRCRRMVFTSHVFLFYFLPLALGAYYLLPFRARTALIAVSSYVFYGWANPIWAVLMFFGSSVDYVCGVGLLKLS